jgi:hypothetical protein
VQAGHVDHLRLALGLEPQRRAVGARQGPGTVYLRRWAQRANRFRRRGTAPGPGCGRRDRCPR